MYKYRESVITKSEAESIVSNRVNKVLSKLLIDEVKQEAFPLSFQEWQNFGDDNGWSKKERKIIIHTLDYLASLEAWEIGFLIDFNLPDSLKREGSAYLINELSKFKNKKFYNFNKIASYWDRLISKYGGPAFLIDQRIDEEMILSTIDALETIQNEEINVAKCHSKIFQDTAGQTTNTVGEHSTPKGMAKVTEDLLSLDRNRVKEMFSGSEVVHRLHYIAPELCKELCSGTIRLDEHTYKMYQKAWEIRWLQYQMTCPLVSFNYRIDQDAEVFYVDEVKYQRMSALRYANESIKLQKFSIPGEAKSKGDFPLSPEELKFLYGTVRNDNLTQFERQTKVRLLGKTENVVPVWTIAVRHGLLPEKECINYENFIESFKHKQFLTKLCEIGWLSTSFLSGERKQINVSVRQLKTVRSNQSKTGLTGSKLRYWTNADGTVEVVSN